MSFKFKISKISWFKTNQSKGTFSVFCFETKQIFPALLFPAPCLHQPHWRAGDPLPPLPLVIDFRGSWTQRGLISLWHSQLLNSGRPDSSVISFHTYPAYFSALSLTEPQLTVNTLDWLYHLQFPECVLLLPGLCSGCSSAWNTLTTAPPRLAGEPLFTKLQLKCSFP